MRFPVTIFAAAIMVAGLGAAASAQTSGTDTQHPAMMAPGAGHAGTMSRGNAMKPGTRTGAMSHANAMQRDSAMQRAKPQ